MRRGADGWNSALEPFVQRDSAGFGAGECLSPGKWLRSQQLSKLFHVLGLSLTNQSSPLRPDKYKA